MIGGPLFIFVFLAESATRPGYDPVSGYPPGTSDQLAQHIRHGALHDFFSLPGFVALAAACFMYGRQFAVRGELKGGSYNC